MRVSRVTAACLAAAALIASAPASATDLFGTVIASGLNNPRGLAFGPDGALYIAETGIVQTSGPSITVRGSTFYYSETGSITRVFDGTQTRIVTGLPSLGSPTSPETTGPADIAFGADGTGYVVLGLGTDPAVRTGAFGADPDAAKLGSVFTFQNNGSTAVVADVSAYEGANNPAGGALDSNPYHLAFSASGLLVTDAGSNTLVKVAPDGTVSLLAVFPSRFIGAPVPMSDSVETGIAIGPDGNYYVAELTGFPFVDGAARIYRVTPAGVVTIAFTGFTNLTDIAFGADGTLYALEADSNGLATPGGSGQLIRVGLDGSQTTLFSGLVTPTGLTIGSNGDFFVTNFSAAQGIGQVLRISAAPEPSTWAAMLLGFGFVGAALRRRRAQVLRPATSS